MVWLADQLGIDGELQGLAAGVGAAASKRFSIDFSESEDMVVF